MPVIEGFSDRVELPNIPEGPGVILIENSSGLVLQVAYSNNVRRRIGEMFDNRGTICAYGPKIYDAMCRGERVYVRWKLTKDYKAERERLAFTLNPQW